MQFHFRLNLFMLKSVFIASNIKEQVVFKYFTRCVILGKVLTAWCLVCSSEKWG